MHQCKSHSGNRFAVCLQHIHVKKRFILNFAWNIPLKHKYEKKSIRPERVEKRVIFVVNEYGPFIKTIKSLQKLYILHFETINDESLLRKSLQSFTFYPKKVEFIILWVILTVQECLPICSKYKSLLFSSFNSFKLIITLSEYFFLLLLKDSIVLYLTYLFLICSLIFAPE